METPTKTKIKAIAIEIERAEGPTNLCITKRFDGDDCWDLARKWLWSMSYTFPKSGYDKHDFKVTYEDGNTYEGRLDCQSDGTDCDVASHVRQFQEFSSGRRRPSHITEKTYKAILNRDPEGGKQAAEMLDKYEIGR